MAQAREFPSSELKPLGRGEEELLEVILLTSIGHIDDLLGTELFDAIKEGGKVGGGVVGRAVLLAHDEGKLGLGVARVAGHVVVPHHQGALTLLGQPMLGQLAVDAVDLVAVEGLAEHEVGAKPELVVDALAGGIGHSDDTLPEGGVGWLTSLELGELGAGSVERSGVGLGQGTALLVEGLEVLECGRASGVELEALALDGEDEDAEVGAPVADVVIAREPRAAELDEAGDGLTDDDGPEVADVHLLGGVGRGVVDDHLAAGVQRCGALAPSFGIGIGGDPSSEGCGREAEVEEARASDLDLEAGLGESALSLEGGE